MGRAVIELDKVGKCYRLGEHHGSGTDLRETLARLGGSMIGRSRPSTREIWALRDVSLTVAEGQALGIIGANGAGKSTLLKVIGGITTPTVGRSRTRGRVGSLIEVGTGFHDELTGLENTYLNGAILGMSRRDVSDRLDEIVEFAGLEGFMETPVKRYSSGMYLRLGFSIAAHMDAEILVVDEVLAVGDAEFQRRCLAKMSEIEHSGRTILFVSHNMDAMAKLCQTTVWIDRGRIRLAGPTRSIIDAYLASGTTPTNDHRFGLDPSAAAQITEVALVGADGRPRSTLHSGSSAWLQVDLVVNDSIPELDLAFIVSTRSGVDLFDEGLADTGCHDISTPGVYRVRAHVPDLLAPGEYVISLWLGTQLEDFAKHEHVLAFTVDGDVVDRPRRRIRLGTEWETSQKGDSGTTP